TGLRSLFRELSSSDWRSKSDARASRSARTSLRGSGSSETQARSSKGLLMAIGSREEMQVCIRYCKDLGYIDDHAFVAWYGGHKEVAKMFRGLHRNWKLQGALPASDF